VRTRSQNPRILKLQHRIQVPIQVLIQFPYVLLSQHQPLQQGSLLPVIFHWIVAKKQSMSDRHSYLIPLARKQNMHSAQNVQQPESIPLPDFTIHSSPAWLLSHIRVPTAFRHVMALPACEHTIPNQLALPKQLVDLVQLNGSGLSKKSSCL